MLNDSCTLPKISIVTPSYNQGIFIEDTVLSVLNQGYENLEYILIDGASSDGSLDIINKYLNRLTYCVSEKDEGQYHAINKGFRHATGEIMAWLNSDDLYFPWTLQCVAEIFSKYPEIKWLTSCYPMSCSHKGIPVYCRSIEGGFSRKGFLKGENFGGGTWNNKGYIQQESTFWRRELWEQAGGYVNEDFQFASDFELWARFFEFADLIGVEVPLSLFRSQENQKSFVNAEKYIDECHQVLFRYGGKTPSIFSTIFKNKISRIFCNALRSLSGAGMHNSRVRYRSGNGWTIHN